MADVFSREKRSQVMASIRGRGNKNTELALITVLRRSKITGWRRHRKIKIPTPIKFRTASGRPWRHVTPDFVFPKERIAIFVDGCFWHACPTHFKIPGNNQSFWKSKIEGNVYRDRFFTSSLRKQGWCVIRIWEHDIRSAHGKIARRIISALMKRRNL